MRSLADESGISLIVAVMTLTVLSILIGSVAVYTTNNVRSSVADRSGATAYHLAEAGLNNAISKLSASPDPTVTTTLTNIPTVVYPELGGSVTYSGTATQTNNQMVWTVTSTGKANVGTARGKTLRQNVVVRGLVPGGDIGSWSRFYQDDPNTCLTMDTVNMPVPFATRGPLCLINGASITGATNTIDVGKTITITGPSLPIGPRYPSTASGWTNSNNVFSSNDVDATTLLGSGGGVSPILSTSNLGFSIPTTAKILGISVSVQDAVTYLDSDSNNSVNDSTVYLQKAGVQIGTNHADSSWWNTSDTTQTYGSATDLWGTTWTAAEINASGFGLLFKAKNIDNNSLTANVDYVRITVDYRDDTNGIGTASTPIADAVIGDKCSYNGGTAATPCTSLQHVNATTVTMAAINPDLNMPTLDLQYWFQEAKPGPMHLCNNPGNNFYPLKFDDNSSTTSDASMQFDNDPSHDMTPPARSYDCQYIENGVVVGELKWDYPSHVLTVSGTIFFDGDVRFDDDGQVVHYQGRALIYAAGDIEFDELVCAGGTGTATCATSMSSWNPLANYLVLMADGNAEYDQGGSDCGGLSNGVTCSASGAHPQSGFQGVVSAQGTCTIHQQFKLSGPVICNKIDLPSDPEGFDRFPTYYAFPSLGQLLDGQKYGDVDSTSSFEVQPGAVTG